MNDKSDINEQVGFDPGSNADQYERLFAVLGRIEEDKPADNFSSSVMDRIERTERRSRWIYLLAVSSATITVITLALAVLFYYSDAEMLLKNKKITIWAVLVGFLIVTIQYLDSKLVRKKSFFPG